MDIIIKTLNNQDSQAIIDTILPIQQVEFGVNITLDDQPDLFKIEEFYIAKGGNFWGASVENKICGTIGLLRFSKNAGAIRKMFVKREFRGKEHGIASTLVETLIQYCKAHEIKDIYLGTIGTMDAAIRFYEKKGFAKVDKKDLPADFPVMFTDDVFYHLTLQTDNII
jgi:N-acetylglutamate synthase-like GNAT family acetyltransferase